ncbi:MAG: hypothetical protein WCK39_00995, partial [Methanomassiliicoccales archaeon]
MPSLLIIPPYKTAYSRGDLEDYVAALEVKFGLRPPLSTDESYSDTKYVAGHAVTIRQPGKLARPTTLDNEDLQRENWLKRHNILEADARAAIQEMRSTLDRRGYGAIKGEAWIDTLVRANNHMAPADEHLTLDEAYSLAGLPGKSADGGHKHRIAEHRVSERNREEASAADYRPPVRAKVPYRIQADQGHRGQGYGMGIDGPQGAYLHAGIPRLAYSVEELSRIDVNGRHPFEAGRSFGQKSTDSDVDSNAHFEAQMRRSDIIRKGTFNQGDEGGQVFAGPGPRKVTFNDRELYAWLEGGGEAIGDKTMYRRGNLYERAGKSAEENLTMVQHLQPSNVTTVGDLMDFDEAFIGGRNTFTWGLEQNDLSPFGLDYYAWKYRGQEKRTLVRTPWLREVDNIIKENIISDRIANQWFDTTPDAYQYFQKSVFDLQVGDTIRDTARFHNARTGLRKFKVQGAMDQGPLSDLDPNLVTSTDMRGDYVSSFMSEHGDMLIAERRESMGFYQDLEAMAQTRKRERGALIEEAWPTSDTLEAAMGDAQRQVEAIRLGALQKKIGGMRASGELTKTLNFEGRGSHAGEYQRMLSSEYGYVVDQKDIDALQQLTQGMQMALTTPMDVDELRRVARDMRDRVESRISEFQDDAVRFANFENNGPAGLSENDVRKLREDAKMQIERSISTDKLRTSDLSRMWIMTGESELAKLLNVNYSLQNVDERRGSQFRSRNLPRSTGSVPVPDRAGYSDAHNSAWKSPNYKQFEPQAVSEYMRRYGYMPYSVITRNDVNSNYASLSESLRDSHNPGLLSTTDFNTQLLHQRNLAIRKNGSGAPLRLGVPLRTRHNFTNAFGISIDASGAERALQDVEAQTKRYVEFAIKNNVAPLAFQLEGTMKRRVTRTNQITGRIDIADEDVPYQRIYDLISGRSTTAAVKIHPVKWGHDMVDEVIEIEGFVDPRWSEGIQKEYQEKVLNDSFLIGQESVQYGRVPGDLSKDGLTKINFRNANERSSLEAMRYNPSSVAYTNLLAYRADKETFEHARQLASANEAIWKNMQSLNRQESSLRTLELLTRGDDIPSQAYYTEAEKLVKYNKTLMMSGGAPGSKDFYRYSPHWNAGLSVGAAAEGRKAALDELLWFDRPNAVHSERMARYAGLELRQSNAASYRNTLTMLAEMSGRDPRTITEEEVEAFKEWMPRMNTNILTHRSMKPFEINSSITTMTGIERVDYMNEVSNLPSGLTYRKLNPLGVLNDGSPGLSDWMFDKYS